MAENSKIKKIAGDALSSLKEKAKNVYIDVTTHWNRPGKGNSIPYKEMLNYGIGGMGATIILYLSSYFTFSAGSTLFGSIIGIRPTHLQNMATALLVLNLFLFIIRGHIVDNTRTRIGRFRPYVIVMGVPIVVLTFIFMFLDFEHMSYMKKLICVFSFGVAIQALVPLVDSTYTELRTVMTPNSAERTVLITVSAITLSLAPTIYNFLIPILSDYTGGMISIETYRFIIAPLGIIGLILVLFAGFGCKERVVQSKEYVQKVGFFEGLKGIFRNKFWWLRTIATQVMFLESAVMVIFGWMFIYGTQNMVAYGVLNTVIGTAATIAMLITPFLLKRIGNRKILILHNAANIVFLSIMYFVFHIPAFFVIIYYCNQVFGQLSIVYDPVMHSEVKDYTQYLSGKRLDFMFGAANQVLLPLIILTGYFIPFVYESMGLSLNYDILFDPTVRIELFRMLVIISIVGGVLNLIPFFFYTLSREKHRQIIYVLKYRSALEDYISGGVKAVNDELLIDVVSGRREAYAVMDAEIISLKDLRAAIKDARILYKRERTDERKEELKNAKYALRNMRTLIEDKKGVNEFTMREFQKFDDEKVMVKLELSEKALSLGINGLKELFSNKGSLSTDMPLEYNPKLNKIVKRYNRQLKIMLIKTGRKYRDAKERDWRRELLNAVEMPENNREEKKMKNKAIKKAEKNLIVYNKIFKPYLDAQKLKDEYDNRFFLDELEKHYEEAVLRDEERERAILEKERIKKEMKAEELKRLREQRFQKLSPKRQAKILKRRDMKEKRLSRKSDNDGGCENE